MLKVNGRTCPDGQEEMRDMLGAAAAQSAVEITFDTSQAPTKCAVLVIARPLHAAAHGMSFYAYGDVQARTVR